MPLSAEQIQQFHDQGFLIIPNLFSAAEIDRMQRECERLSAIDTDRKLEFARIHTVYDIHRTDGPTASPVYSAVGSMPRLLGAAQQLLDDKQLYIHNSRLYGKDPLVGSAMMWHQDFGYWRLDSIASPTMLTAMIALGDVDPLHGGLWIIPGSHKDGLRKHYSDATTPFKQWTIDLATMRDVMAGHPEPVPLAGKSGFAAFFHANIIHASAHNFSASDRWQAYFVYNRSSNAPTRKMSARPSYICATEYAPMTLGRDDALTRESASLSG